MPLGAGVGALGNAVTRYRTEVTLAGGAVLIALGLMALAGKGFGLGAAQRASARIKISSTTSVVALGVVYGLAGFCAGPLLGSVLAVSAMGADPIYVGVLMAIYALGMAAPLFVLAWVWDRFELGKRGWLRGRAIHVGRLQTHTTSLVTGVILIGVGLLFVLTEGTAGFGGVLDVDTQFDLRVWLSSIAGGVDDSVILLGVVAILPVFLGVRIKRRSKGEAAELGSDG